MAANSASPKGKAAGWTDTERIELLLNFLDQQGGISWKDMKLPPGRSQKACMHAIAKMRDEVKRRAGENSEAPTPPGKTAKATPAKKNNGKKRKIDESDAASDDATPTPPAKKKNTSKAKQASAKNQNIKQEDEGMGEEGEDEEV